MTRRERWFAWFPVPLEDAGWAWLRKVWREGQWFGGEPFFKYYKEDRND